MRFGVAELDYLRLLCLANSKVRGIISANGRMYGALKSSGTCMLTNVSSAC